MKIPKLLEIIGGIDLSESSKKYKFFKDDSDKDPVEIEADSQEDADKKIKKITGRDPKDVTKWADGIDESLDDDLFEDIEFESKIVPSKANIPKYHQYKIAVDTVKNPNKSFLGGMNTEEAEEILRTEYKYTDDDINKLRGVKESNCTTSLDYGDGQIKTPLAFSNKNRKMVGDSYINEVAYKEWASDDTTTSKYKINKAIHEVSKNLFELERIIGRTSKLKSEINADHGIYWKQTIGRFTKINERLLKISSQIRNIYGE